MQELKSITKKLQDVFEGDPWYGKSVTTILAQTDPSKVYVRLHVRAHTLVDLLYHMITWVDFTLQQVEDKEHLDPKKYVLLDWREINPEVHTWEAGVAEIRRLHQRLIQALSSSSDEILEEQASHRSYNMRCLLNGLADHQIYHAGQIAFLQKALSH